MVGTDKNVKIAGQGQLHLALAPWHCSDVETQKARVQRLGALVKRRRKARGIRRVEDLAYAAGIGRTTLVAIETGKKIVTSAMYNALELELGLPIDTMESVIRGEITEFPEPAPAYPPETYEEVLRTEQERQIMAVKGMSEEGKWKVIFGLREQVYDQTQAENDHSTG